MSIEQFQISLKIAHPFVPDRAIPHAFVTIDGPGISPLTVGYYPYEKRVSAAGYVGNDGMLIDPNTKLPYEHPYDSQITFTVCARQVETGLRFIDQVARNPGDYRLIGESDKTNWIDVDGYQCTGFARDVLKSMGIKGFYDSPLTSSAAPPETLRAIPSMLLLEYGLMPTHQVQPGWGDGTSVSELIQLQESILNGIAEHTPQVSTETVADRSRSIGEVVVSPESTGNPQNQQVPLSTGDPIEKDKNADREETSAGIFHIDGGLLAQDLYGISSAISGSGRFLQIQVADGHSVRVDYMPGTVTETFYDASGQVTDSILYDLGAGIELPPRLLPSHIVPTYGVDYPFILDTLANGTLALSADGDGADIQMFIHPAGTPDNEEAGWDVNSPEFFRVGDGLLVRDLNGTGAIDAGRELFANPSFMAPVTGQQPTDSLSFLHELDSHPDGIIDASDTGFSQLRVWTDLNEDGFSQSEELMALDADWAYTLAGTLPYGGDQRIETAFTSTRLSTSQGGIAPPDEAGRRENSATGSIDAAINPVTEAALSAQLSQWVSAMASFNPPGAGAPLSLGYVIEDRAPTLAAAWQ